MPEALTGPDPGATAAALEAAAALLLREPDARTLELVKAWSGEEVDLARARQDFYDVLLIPQSGRFVPPYEHVQRQARRVGPLWTFPPARHDGGDLVERHFRRLGFDRRRLQVHPVLAAPHLPADHIGFVFAFLAFALRAIAAGRAPEDAALQFAVFVRRHLDAWVERYAELLEDRGGVYLRALATAVREAAAAAREAAAALDPRAGGAGFSAAGT